MMEEKNEEDKKLKKKDCKVLHLVFVKEQRKKDVFKRCALLLMKTAYVQKPHSDTWKLNEFAFFSTFIRFLQCL